MRRTPADDPEAPWLAVLCTGILLTMLAGTVCLCLVTMYGAKVEDVQPVLACFGVGALFMLGAAARLDYLSATRARTHRR